MATLYKNHSLTTQLSNPATTGPKHPSWTQPSCSLMYRTYKYQYSPDVLHVKHLVGDSGLLPGSPHPNSSICLMDSYSSTKISWSRHLKPARLQGRHPICRRDAQVNKTLVPEIYAPSIFKQVIKCKLCTDSNASSLSNVFQNPLQG